MANVRRPHFGIKFGGKELTEEYKRLVLEIIITE